MSFIHSYQSSSSRAQSSMESKGEEVRSTSMISKDGDSMLHTAIRLGNLEMVTLLVNSNASLTVSNKDGSTPLQTAVEYNQLKIAEFLIKKGASANPTKTATKTNAEMRIDLVQSVREGDLETIKSLLKDGLRVNETNLSGQSLLTIAVEQGHIHVAKFLLKKGAYANQSLIYNLFILLAKAPSEDLEFVKFLISQGFSALPRSKQNSVWTGPPYYSPSRGSMDKGLELTDPLCYAIQHSNFLIAKFLIPIMQKGGFLDHNHLCFAAKVGSMEIFKIISDQGVLPMGQVRHLDPYCIPEFPSPIWEALSSGHLTMVRELCAKYPHDPFLCFLKYVPRGDFPQPGYMSFLGRPDMMVALIKSVDYVAHALVGIKLDRDFYLKDLKDPLKKELVKMDNEITKISNTKNLGKFIDEQLVFNGVGKLRDPSGIIASYLSKGDLLPPLGYKNIKMVLDCIP